MTSGQHGEDNLGRSDIEALGATRAELGKTTWGRRKQAMTSEEKRAVWLESIGGVSTQLLYGRVVETAIGATIGVAVVITTTLLATHWKRHRLLPENKRSAH